MKLVLDTKPGSGYRDTLAHRYHFPARYLASVREGVGDWAVFRRPRAGGGHMGYLGTGRIIGIDPDPETPGHHYAWIGDFLPFDRIVPLSEENRYFEASLRDLRDRAAAGRSLRGRSARPVSDEDFASIVSRGLSETLAPENAVRLGLDARHLDDATRALLTSAADAPRRIVQILLNRKVREASFRRQVVDAYDARCAVTRLRIINGGGRAEVQAAHIWPVSQGGPDTVGNGLALSSTVHWLFDRHLISLDEDYRLLVAHNRVPSEYRRLFHEHEGRIHLPDDEALWPQPDYVRRHREAYLAA